MDEILKCPVTGCDKEFKSELMFNAHMATTHPKWKKEDIVVEQKEEENVVVEEKEEIIKQVDVEQKEDIKEEVEEKQELESDDRMVEDTIELESFDIKDKEIVQKLVPVIEQDTTQELHVPAKEFKCPMQGCNREFGVQEFLDAHLQIDHNMVKVEENNMKFGFMKAFRKKEGDKPKLVKQSDLPIKTEEVEDIFLHIRVSKGTGIKGRIMEQMDIDPDVNIISTLSGNIKSQKIDSIMNDAVNTMDFVPNENDKKDKKAYY